MKNHGDIGWAAVWIESDLCGGPRTGAPAPYFRREFKLPEKPRKALLHITALGLYAAGINGSPVHEAELIPGWTVFEKRLRYQTWDVTNLLRNGRNAIGVILGDGWYCGYLGNNDRQNYGDRPKLLAQLEWIGVDGKKRILVSDEQWRVSSGPILENDLLMGETYDARKEMPGWDLPGFDDSEWRNARSVAAPSLTLEPHTGAFVRRHESFRGRLVEGSPCSARRRIFDLGQNISGRVRIAVRGAPGATIQIRHAEMLGPHGWLYTDNLRGARATDCYTLKGGGREVWEPCFTFHGFRYVEVLWTNPREPGTVEALEGIVLHSDMPRTGNFDSSNPLLNQLYQNTIWGQKGNFLEVPTDCPQRDERMGWTGDAQVFIRTAAINMDVLDFFRKWLRDIRDTQGSDGCIPSYIPFIGSFGPWSDGGPAWADAAIICPFELYRAFGELDVIADNYDCMTAYMRYIAARKVKNGVREHPDLKSFKGFGDWLALDGSGRTDGGTPKDLIGTAFYANNARILAECARLLGRAADQRRWEALRRKTVQVFQKRYLSPEGLMVSSTQTACVLALHFDLVTPAQRPGTIAQLVQLIEQNGFRIGTGFVGTPYILHALEAAGRLDVAYRLLEQEAFPSWLFPVKNGATTIWERWDGWTPEKGFQSAGMNSFNHYAYGSVCDWMVGTVAGIEPAEPGYRRIRFKPRPGGSLKHASAELITRHGKAAISWKLAGNTLKLKLIVPRGTSAVLDSPASWRPVGRKFSAGTHAVTLKSIKS